MTTPLPDPVAAVAEQYVAFLTGDASEPNIEDLPEGSRRIAREICRDLAAAWHVGDLDPPALERDPVAISLGLVADPSRPLNGQALKQLRQRAGWTVSSLGDRLRKRGWEISTGDVYTWERQESALVPPAIISALSNELGVAETRLIGSVAQTPTTVAAVVRTGKFEALARRWTAAIGLADASRGAAALQQLMLVGVVRRGGDLDVEQWLGALEALVEARERPGAES
jgi:transcriptional regulator with XRE-family HTH domain